MFIIADFDEALTLYLKVIDYKGLNTSDSLQKNFGLVLKSYRLFLFALLSGLKLFVIVTNKTLSWAAFAKSSFLFLLSSSTAVKL